MKPIGLLLLGGSLAALGAAYISQYIFGLMPCELCYYQRYPYVVAAVIGALIYIAPTQYVRALALLGLTAIMADAAIAFYHMGVEYKWFAGLESCSAGVALPNSVEAAVAQLLETPAIRCDTPQFVFLLSMAGWNMLYALGLAGVIAALWRKTG